MCVCIYLYTVCVYVCTDVYVCAWIIDAYICILVYRCVHKCINAYTCVYLYMRVCIKDIFISFRNDWYPAVQKARGKVKVPRDFGKKKEDTRLRLLAGSSAGSVIAYSEIGAPPTAVNRARDTGKNAGIMSSDESRLSLSICQQPCMVSPRESVSLFRGGFEVGYGECKNNEYTLKLLKSS